MPANPHTIPQSDPVISVIVPLFNRESIVQETLRSIASQTFQSFEVIVVDDCSSDSGPQLVQSFSASDRRFRLVRRASENSGASVCRNLGLKEAIGKFVVFLDSDDLLSKNCLEDRLSGFMVSAHVDMVIAQGLIFCTSPGDRRTLWNVCDYDPCDSIVRFFDQDMPWANGAALWRRESIDAIGGWNIELRCFQDWELHTRACVAGLRYRVLPKPDFYIRRSESVDQISKAHNTSQHVESRVRAFESVVALAESKKKLTGSIRRSARGFLLRNHLSLHDASCREEAMSILQCKSASKLLKPPDLWLLKWIRKQGESWHWNKRVKTVANIWWRDLQYDSLNMHSDFMKTEWPGVMP